MNYLYRLVRYPFIYLAISAMLVLLAMTGVINLARHNIEDNLDIPLVKTLGTYAATLEGGTTNSRAMGAAILYGVLNQKAKQLVTGKQPSAEPEVSSALETLRTLYTADLVHLVNKKGIVVAYSSKDRAPGKGRDLSFRPYVKLALQGTPNVYPAVGVISPDRGIYLAAPMRVATNLTSDIIGAVVVKVGSDKLDALLKTWTNGAAVLLSPQGVVFAASRDDWLFHMTGDMSANRIAEIRRTMQFGKVFDQTEPLALPFGLNKPETVISGQRYAVRSIALEWNDPAGDWSLAFLERRTPWWTHWSVLGFASFTGLFVAMAMYWFFSLVRNAFLLESINGELSSEVAERKRAETQLTKSLSLLNATLESAKDAILVVDLNNLWVLYNHKFVDLWHFTDEIINTKDDKAALSFVLNQLEQPEIFINKVNELYSAPEASSSDIIQFKDGKIIERYSIPQRIDGKVVGRVWSFHDVTESKLAENALKESMRLLEEKEFAKSRFLAAAGHDLRQPLAAANLFIDALRFTEPTSGQIQIIQRLDQAMLNFNGLLESLLNISKLDAGVIKPEYSLISVPEIFNWLEHTFALQAVEKQLGFKLYFSMEESLVVNSDFSLLKSVLLNLVSNAIKFTSKGGILISARQRGRELLFQVWDTGIGIQNELIEHIFDEFYQINNPQRDRASGLGLGLSIAKRAMALLDGKIDCRSRIDRGSVFGFSLPLGHASSDAAQHGIPNTTQNAIVQDSFARGKRFVVVEDDALVAEAISNILLAMGGQVETFHNAENALSGENIALADYYIVDYMLGGSLNGIQFLNQLRDKFSKAVNAVLVTGDTSPVFVRGASDCEWPVLHKPVNLSKILACLGTQVQ